MRRVAFAAALLICSLAVVAPVAAASATSWRAILLGDTIHGGATTLIQNDGRGSINVKLYGVPAGQPVAVAVNAAACPAEAPHLLSFLTLEASADGIATGRHWLTPAQVTAYNAALSARTALSILAVTNGGTACGDQVGWPKVATARLRDTKTGMYDYDIRYPVVSGIGAPGAAAVNTVLRDTADATIAAFIEQAAEALQPGETGMSTATQTFSVSLNQSLLLSLAERYNPELVSAPHADVQILTFEFDLATGDRIKLDQLFGAGAPYLEVLSNESRKRLAARLGDFAAALTVPRASNFDAWQLVRTGIQITFSQAQGFGIPPTAVTVPWAALRPHLNLSSPIARLLPPGWTSA